MCNNCFNDKQIHTKTSLVVKYEDKKIIIQKIPCLECPYCGEKAFTDEVSAKLEKLANDLKIKLASSDKKSIRVEYE